MPGQTRDARRVMDLLAEISPDTFVNVMDQYRPCWKAASVPGLDRRPTEAELSAARSRAMELGLRLAD
jgi:putative pyruvate formate lyase activating enzyme